ncbi:MAG: hypothetical protein R3B70_05285 [Polyangiaceae bacterium]
MGNLADRIGVFAAREVVGGHVHHHERHLHEEERDEGGAEIGTPDPADQRQALLLGSGRKHRSWRERNSAGRQDGKCIPEERAAVNAGA